MRFFLTTVLLLGVYLGAGAQPRNTILLADSLLVAGKHKAALVSYEFPPDIKELQDKAARNLKNNPEWKEKNLVHMVEKGTGNIPYVDAYGLTREEFEHMIAGFRNKRRPVLGETYELVVRKKGDLIGFTGSGKLSMFNYLTLDKKNFQIIFDNSRITREVKLEGKFYAPVLHGYEAFWPEEMPGKTATTKASAGFSIGKNENDDKSTLCLLLTYGVDKTDFQIITLLD